MSTFRNRNGKWQARIQRQGQVPVSKLFGTRQDAERWARQVEAQMDQGKFVSLRLDERTTLGELITRYMVVFLQCSPQQFDLAAQRTQLIFSPTVTVVIFKFFTINTMDRRLYSLNPFSGY